MSARQETESEELLRIHYLKLAYDTMFNALCLPADEPDRAKKIAAERERLEYILAQFGASSGRIPKPHPSS